MDTEGEISCQNLYTKTTGLTFFERFVIVIGWERHFPRLWQIYPSCIEALKGLFFSEAILIFQGGLRYFSYLYKSN